MIKKNNLLLLLISILSIASLYNYNFVYIEVAFCSPMDSEGELEITGDSVENLASTAIIIPEPILERLDSISGFSEENQKNVVNIINTLKQNNPEYKSKFNSLLKKNSFHEMFVGLKKLLGIFKTTNVTLSYQADYSENYLNNYLNKIDDEKNDIVWSNFFSIKPNLLLLEKKNLLAISRHISSHYHYVETYIDKLNSRSKNNQANLDLNIQVSISSINDAYKALIKFLSLGSTLIDNLRNDLNKLEVPTFDENLNTPTISFGNKYNYMSESTDIQSCDNWVNRLLAVKFYPTTYHKFLHFSNDTDYQTIRNFYILLFEFFSPHIAARFFSIDPRTISSAISTIPPTAATREVALTPTSTEIYNMYYGWENPPTSEVFGYSRIPFDYGWDPQNPLRPVRSLCINQYTGPLARTYVLTTFNKPTTDSDLVEFLIDNDSSGINPEHFQHWIRDIDPTLISLTNEALHNYSNWFDKLTFFVFSYFNGPGGYCPHNIPNNIEPYCTIQQLFGTKPYSTRNNSDALYTIRYFIQQSNGSYLISFNESFKIAFEQRYGPFFYIENVRDLYVIEHPHDIEQALIGQIEPEYTRVHPIHISEKGNQALYEETEAKYNELREELIEEDTETYGVKFKNFYHPRLDNLQYNEPLLTIFKYKSDSTSVDSVDLDVTSYSGYNRRNHTYLDVLKYIKKKKRSHLAPLLDKINSSYITTQFRRYNHNFYTNKLGVSDVTFFFYKYLFEHTTFLDTDIEKISTKFQMDLPHLTARKLKSLFDLANRFSINLTPKERRLELKINKILQKFFDEQYNSSESSDEFFSCEEEESNIPGIYKSTHSEASSSRG